MLDQSYEADRQRSQRMQQQSDKLSSYGAVSEMQFHSEIGITSVHAQSVISNPLPAAAVPSSSIVQTKQRASYKRKHLNTTKVTGLEPDAPDAKANNTSRPRKPGLPPTAFAKQTVGPLSSKHQPQAIGLGSSRRQKPHQSAAANAGGSRF